MANTALGDKQENAIDGILGMSLGLISVSRNGLVLSRSGLLARWAPETGHDIFEDSLLFGMRDYIDRNVIAGGHREVLTELSLDTPAGQICIDIEIVWDEAAQKLQLAVYDASARLSEIFAGLQVRRTSQCQREMALCLRGLISAYRRALAEVIAQDPEVSCTQAIQRLWKYENMADELQQQIDKLDVQAGARDLALTG